MINLELPTKVKELECVYTSAFGHLDFTILKAFYLVVSAMYRTRHRLVDLKWV